MRGALAAMALALALGAGGTGRAEAPAQALRPEARGAAEAPVEAESRPAARPAPAEPPRAMRRAGTEAPGAASRFAVALAIRPGLRPPRAAADRPLPQGALCNNPLIRGDLVAPIRGDGGCGIDGAVRVRSLDGVLLSDGALMDCVTASSLLDWVVDGARPAIGTRGGGLAALEVMGHYACRPRNNQAGARLSEHGRGRAIDVGGLVLRDGTRLSVLRDWPDPALRAMHAAACGPFTTVLGPAANALHRDHFHFDTARGRGPYCR